MGPDSSSPIIPDLLAIIRATHATVLRKSAEAADPGRVMAAGPYGTPGLLHGSARAAALCSRNAARSLFFLVGTISRRLDRISRILCRCAVLHPRLQMGEKADSVAAAQPADCYLRLHRRDPRGTAGGHGPGHALRFGWPVRRL